MFAPLGYRSDRSMPCSDLEAHRYRRMRAGKYNLKQWTARFAAPCRHRRHLSELDQKRYRTLKLLRLIGEGAEEPHDMRTLLARSARPRSFTACSIAANVSSGMTGATFASIVCSSSSRFGMSASMPPAKAMIRRSRGLPCCHRDSLSAGRRNASSAQARLSPTLLRSLRSECFARQGQRGGWRSHAATRRAIPRAPVTNHAA